MELGAAIMRREQCQEQLLRAGQEIAHARHAQLSAPGSELRAHQAYLERLEDGERQLMHELSGHEQDVSARRATLTERSQDRQALEKLKEKGLEAHNREAARVEQVMLDEIAGNGHWRRAA